MGRVLTEVCGRRKQARGHVSPHCTTSSMLVFIPVMVKCSNKRSTKPHFCVPSLPLSNTLAHHSLSPRPFHPLLLACSANHADTHPQGTLEHVYGTFSLTRNSIEAWRTGVERSGDDDVSIHQVPIELRVRPLLVRSHHVLDPTGLQEVSQAQLVLRTPCSRAPPRLHCQPPLSTNVLPSHTVLQYLARVAG